MVGFVGIHYLEGNVIVINSTRLFNYFALFFDRSASYSRTSTSHLTFLPTISLFNLLIIKNNVIYSTGAVKVLEGNDPIVFAGVYSHVFTFKKNI